MNPATATVKVKGPTTMVVEHHEGRGRRIPTEEEFLPVATAKAMQRSKDRDGKGSNSTSALRPAGKSTATLASGDGGNAQDSASNLPFAGLRNEPAFRLALTLPVTKPMNVITGSSWVGPLLPTPPPTAAYPGSTTPSPTSPRTPAATTGRVTPRYTPSPGKGLTAQFSASTPRVGHPKEKDPASAAMDGQTYFPHFVRRDFSRDPEHAPTLPTFAFNMQSSPSTYSRQGGHSALTESTSTASVSARGGSTVPQPRSSLAASMKDDLSDESDLSHRALLFPLAKTPTKQFVNRLPNPNRSTWQEPHPKNLRRLGQTRQWLSDFPVHVLQRMLSFLPSKDLDQAAVLACRTWAYAIQSSKELYMRRRLFLPGSAQPSPSYSTGILRYLGTHCHRLHYLCTEGNPGAGPAPPVRLACSLLGAEAPLCTCNSQQLQRPASGFASRSKANSESSPGNICAITAPRLSHFSTPSMPYAWVGMDFGEFRVQVSHYTVGTSNRKDVGLPLEWELQGCVDDRRDVGGVRAPKGWGDCLWVVLDKRKGEYFNPGSTKESDRVKTFPIAATRHASGDGIGSEDIRGSSTDPSDSTIGWKGEEVVPLLLSKPMKLLRIVQLGRNTHWGMDLCISGLEFYGQLLRADSAERKI